MPDTFQDNGVDNGSSPKSNGRTGRRCEVLKEGGGAGMEGAVYPEQNCVYYLRTGACGYGTKCRYNHPNYVGQEQFVVYGFRGELPERDREPDCEFFLKTGTCKFGSLCKYNHPRDKNGAGPVSFNILGLPMRPEETSCKFYLRTGQCKFGPSCKFHHPQPAVPGSVFHVNGNMPFGSPESSSLPIRAFPALPMPAPTYIYNSPMDTHQAYMHMAISPPLSFLPQQGWNALSGNISHISSTSSFGPCPTYNSNTKSFGESCSNGQVQYLSPVTQYPDRPECRYFKNNGTCKYGLDCKYNHPKAIISQLHPLPLIPLAYPGQQPLCSSYITYGKCQNGSVCKLRHQGDAYPLYYGFIPIPAPIHMPIYDEYLSGRKNSMVIIPSETSSPSKSTKDLDGHNNLEATQKSQDSDTNSQEEPKIEKSQHSDTNRQQTAHAKDQESHPPTSPKQQHD